MPVHTRPYLSPPYQGYIWNHGKNSNTWSCKGLCKGYIISRVIWKGFIIMVGLSHTGLLAVSWATGLSTQGGYSYPSSGPAFQQTYIYIYKQTQVTGLFLHYQTFVQGFQRVMWVVYTRAIRAIRAIRVIFTLAWLSWSVRSWLRSDTSVAVERASWQVMSHYQGYSDRWYDILRGLYHKNESIFNVSNIHEVVIRVISRGYYIEVIIPVAGHEETE